MLHLEVRKLRHKHYWSIALGSFLLQLAWNGAMVAKRASGSQDMALMGFALNELMSMVVLLAPATAALLASRLVTVDTEGRMDQAWAAVGQREGARFTSKLVVGASTLAILELAVLAGVAIMGRASGLQVDAVWRTATPWCVVVIVAASIAAIAVQLCLARLFEKQGVGLGVGAVASLALSGLGFNGLQAFGWLFPWGIPVAANPIDPKGTIASVSAGGSAVLVDHPGRLACIALVLSLVWALVARMVLSRKEKKA